MRLEINFAVGRSHVAFMKRSWAGFRPSVDYSHDADNGTHLFFDWLYLRVVYYRQPVFAGGCMGD